MWGFLVSIYSIDPDFFILFIYDNELKLVKWSRKTNAVFPPDLLVFYEMDFCVLMDCCISFGMNNEIMKIQS